MSNTAILSKKPSKNLSLKGKLTNLKRILPAVIKCGRNSRSAVLLDTNGTPQFFLFNTPAFLDMLSAIDEALVDRLSTEEYYDSSVNPAGELIDRIEVKLPLKPKFISSLKKAIEEADKKGWIR